MACQYCGMEKTTSKVSVKYTDTDLCDSCKTVLADVLKSVPQGHQNEIMRPGYRILFNMLLKMWEDIKAIKTKVGA